MNFISKNPVSSNFLMKIMCFKQLNKFASNTKTTLYQTETRFKQMNKTQQIKTETQMKLNTQSLNTEAYTPSWRLKLDGLKPFDFKLQRFKVFKQLLKKLVQKLSLNESQK